jgi:uncharacterized membrane protein
MSKRSSPSLSERTKAEVQNATGRFFLPTLIVIGVVAIGVVCAVVAYGIFFPDQYRNNGTWGDFTGGLLNPILTCLTFIGVLLTVALQRLELTFTREEVARSADALEAQEQSLSFQNFETTFFEMLKMNNEINSSIDLYNYQTKRTTKGRDTFGVFLERLHARYIEKDRHVQQGYARFWKDAHTELAHYFRFLFNFVRFVDEAKKSEPYHMRLLRSQLSNSELALLFYNSLTPEGKKFRQYVEKHALFDNIHVSKLLEQKHILLFARAAYGNNEEVLALYDRLQQEKQDGS